MRHITTPETIRITTCLTALTSYTLEHIAKLQYCKFDTVCLIECGNRGHELFLVTTTNGSIKLTNLIPQVYELYPTSKEFALFVDEVRREPDGKISIRLYSPTEDRELVVQLDENLKLVSPDI